MGPLDASVVICIELCAGLELVSAVFSEVREGLGEGFAVPTVFCWRGWLVLET